MVRAFVLYEGDVDPERYQQHIDEFVRPDPGDVPPRQGRSPTPPGMEQRFRYYAEFEFPDMDVVHAGRDLARVRAPPGRTRRRWASRSASTSRTSSDRARSPAPVGRRARLRAILYEKAPPRATITFNRPEVLNAFDSRDAARARARPARTRRRTTTSASSSSPARAARSASARTFAPGQTRASSGTSASTGSGSARWTRGVTAIREIGKPTVARINGICVGGGNEMQMACDLAVMVDDAFIRHVGLQHGSVPAAGATQWLPIIVGDRRAREIILLCEEIPARRRRSGGSSTAPCRRAELDATVDELRREARRPAAADDPLREGAARLLPRPGLARHDSATRTTGSRCRC